MNTIDTTDALSRLQDRPLGAYRRRIMLHADDGKVFGALEDDFHHFHAEVRHDGQSVTQASGRAIRVPRNTCPNAVERLERFVGMPLADGARGIDAHQQCTHLFDVVRLAMTHALRGGRRQYDIMVPDPVDDRQSPGIWRDGQPVLKWEVRGKAIVAPGEFACDDLFARVNWKHFDPDTLEAAMLLRRGIWISWGRKAQAVIQVLRAQGKPLQGQWMPTSLMGACYSYQPEVHAVSEQNPDSFRDFTHVSGAMLAELPGEGFAKLVTGTPPEVKSAS